MAWRIGPFGKPGNLDKFLQRQRTTTGKGVTIEIKDRTTHKSDESVPYYKHDIYVKSEETGKRVLVEWDAGYTIIAPALTLAKAKVIQERLEGQGMRVKVTGRERLEKYLEPVSI